MPAAPSKSQIDKLGERLRRADHVADDDLLSLQRVRAAYDDALAVVTERLAMLESSEGSLRPSSRLKTIGTIIDKLRRESVRLSQMDDIAGARVVIGGGMIEQDAVVQAIRAVFPSTTVKDRRERPSFGYRSVHVIVEHEARRVEIQVRTPPQDLWAQVMERVSDAWGRGIRYGEGPIPIDAENEDHLDRAGFVDLLMKASEQIRIFENDEAELEMAARPEGSMTTALQERLAMIRRSKQNLADALRPFAETDF